MSVSHRIRTRLSDHWRNCFAPIVFSVVLLLALGADSNEAADSDDPRPSTGTFMVIDQGTALLGPDGNEIKHLTKRAYAAGALSRDGKWVVFVEADIREPGKKRSANMLVQSMADPEKRESVPMIWGTTGSSFLPIWSADSMRIFICEQGYTDNIRESAFRIYDLGTRQLTELKLPKEWWPSDWSADEKRLLIGLDGRIAWVSIDGTGEPEFITPELEVAYGAKLSPDGRKILCMAGPRRRGDTPQQRRLSVFDAGTKLARRIIVDEPGETHGYCWSHDGSRIAYTWQHSFDELADKTMRETFLITCDPDGSMRKTVTSRKHQVPENDSGLNTTIIYFQVFAWLK